MSNDPDKNYLVLVIYMMIPDFLGISTMHIRICMSLVSTFHDEF